MAEPSVDIDVFFVGQTGVGKSSLINMMMNVPYGKEGVAKVSNDAPPCTMHATSYPMSLETGLRCQLWDTRGLGEAVDTRDRSWMTKIVDRIRLLASQQARELKETLRDRTGPAIPILVWCMDASKIDVQPCWQQFFKVYVEYCGKKAIPVVVITRMLSSATDWEQTCNNQLQLLGLGEGSTVNVTLLRVREYQKTAPDQYKEDSRALRNLISSLAKH